MGRLLNMTKLRSNNQITKDFLNKITINLDTGCWEWIAHKLPNGYGRLRLFNKNILAHRAMWFMMTGEIPTKFVCHKCNNKSCINPSHLYLANNSKNLRDAYRDGLFPKNRKGKIDIQQKIEIVKLFKTTKYTRTELGELFGVSRTAVSNYIRKYSNVK